MRESAGAARLQCCKWNADDFFAVLLEAVVVIDNNTKLQFPFLNEIVQRTEFAAINRLPVFDLNGQKAEIPFKEQVNLRARASPVIEMVAGNALTGNTPQYLLDDHAFPGMAHARMGNKSVHVAYSQQVVEKAGVAHETLGMLHDTFERLFFIGRDLAPDKRACRNLEIIPHCRLRYAESARNIGIIDNGSGKI